MKKQENYIMRILFAALLIVNIQYVCAYSFKKNGICYNITSGSTVEVTYYATASGATGSQYNVETQGSVVYRGTYQNYSCRYYPVTHYYSGEIVIPSIVHYSGKEYIVTAIGDHAFDDCNDLVSVTIPCTVTRIGILAFSCYASPDVPLDNASAYSGNARTPYTSLVSVKFESMSQLKTIDSSAFYNARSLTSIVIPQYVTSIGGSAFWFCTSLAEIISDVKEPIVITENVFKDVSKENCTLYVPEGSEGNYSIASCWNEFNHIIGNPHFEEGASLSDGSAYSSPLTLPDQTITYTRTFNNTNWQALYVPFSLSYEDFCSNFEVAYVNDVHQFDDDDNGTIDRTVLEMIKLKPGMATEPNTPYVIKSKTTGEKTITLEHATLYPAEENEFDVTSWFTKYTLTGTYHIVTDMATKGHYANSNGSLKQASSDAVVLNPYRWYMDVTDRRTGAAVSLVKEIFMEFDDEETTAADVFVADNAENDSNEYFTIGGQRMNGKVWMKNRIIINKGKKYIK